MTKREIDLFIEIMKTIHEDWTPEEVEEKYGDCTTLREALDRYKYKMNTFFNYVEEVIKPEAENLGLWPK